MNVAALEEEICSFVSRTFLFEFDGTLTRDSDLFDAGLIDSYGFIELVAFLEQTYVVKLTDDDLASPQMATLSGITRLVADRRTATR